jgi:hypothetical protein
MNNDKDFINDPLFKELRNFAAKDTGPESMPAELFTAFRVAQSKKVRNKWTLRTVIGLVGVGIALPSLSYAHVLPKPIENVVNRVTHFVSAPVRVVASVITTEPVPTPSTSPTSSPDPTPTPSGNVPTPTQIPVAPTPKHSVSNGEENKTENHSENKKNGSTEKNSEGSNQSKSESNKSGELESSARPVASTPSVASGESSNKSGGESKSSESGSKSGGESE